MTVEELILSCGAYLEGDFVLKDGSRSCCFVDLGRLTGTALLHLAKVMVWRLCLLSPIADVLVAPPYKAIPLAAVMSALSGIPFDFYRKEVKPHGEGGDWVTKALRSGMTSVIVDDVFTSGTAKREAICRVRQIGAVVLGILVVVDRSESEIPTNIDGVPVWSLTTLKKIKKAYHDSGAAL
ncbi:MAG: phosphoribosyltransferase family protein [Candidatus Hadarchaeum sp.]